MLTSRAELEKYIEEKCIKLAVDPEKFKELYDFVYEKYNISRGIISDFTMLRKSLSEATEFILFCILDGMVNVGITKEHVLEMYYTIQEIQTYGKSKAKVDNIKFPLTFKMIEIKYDQWIGKISVNELMELRKAQLINYNTNSQRAMQKIVRGDKNIYKIMLNKSAIKDIENMFDKQQFIPNTLTLNIPLDSDNDFYYDTETSSLVIRSLDHFDITDGYHRYIAACQIKDKNPDFDYDMELRIVNFSEEKAKQFIFQEDQKTKMKKIDSDSLNMTKAANVVVTRINESSSCNLQGMINRNEGLISFGQLAESVNYFYFRNVERSKERAEIISVTKELIEDFNLLTEYNPYYLSMEYTFKHIFSLVYAFKLYQGKDDKTGMCKLIDDLFANVDKLNDKKFFNRRARKSLVNEVENLIKEEGMQNV